MYASQSKRRRLSSAIRTTTIFFDGKTVIEGTMTFALGPPQDEA